MPFKSWVCISLSSIPMMILPQVDSWKGNNINFYAPFRNIINQVQDFLDATEKYYDDPIARISEDLIWMDPQPLTKKGSSHLDVIPRTAGKQAYRRTQQTMKFPYFVIKNKMLLEKPQYVNKNLKIFAYSFHPEKLVFLLKQYIMRYFGLVFLLTSLQ